MKLKFAALCAPIAILAACGGGDSAPPPTGGGGPTPSPSPSPSPTPSISYTAFDDLTGDQSFRTACTIIETNGGGFATGFAASTRSDFAPLSFTEATETWSIELAAPGDDTRSFGPSDLIADPPEGRIAYERANAGGGTDAFTVTLSDFGSISFDYLRGTDFIGNRNTGAFIGLPCVFGVPTVLEDTLPTGGVAYTEVTVTGAAFVVDRTSGLVTTTYELSESIATLSADAPADDEINTTINLRGREILPNGDLSDTVVDFRSYGNGFSAINTEIGSDSVERGEFQGAFEFGGSSQIGAEYIGWFFGPEGVEAGYAFSIRYFEDGTNNELFFLGQVLAKQ